MGRKQPIKPTDANVWPPAVAKQSDNPQLKIGKTEIIVQKRQYKLITPLFGGGVEAGYNDPDNLIRATEIRGQLRFWWRAIRGGNPAFEGSLDKMKAREDEIWGAANNTKSSEKQPENAEQSKVEARDWRGAVQIEVEEFSGGQELQPYCVYKDDNDHRIRSKLTNKVPAYVVFPLQPSQDELNQAGKPADVWLKTVWDGTTFTLKISFMGKWKFEVEAALWAWETFGGIGARTRRGAGAIQVIAVDGVQQVAALLVTSSEAEKRIRDELRKLSAGEQFPEHVPHLSSDMQLCALDAIDEPFRIWEMLIGKLSSFRQQKKQLSEQKQFTGKKKIPGPNKWPEAEAIRKRVLGKVKGRNANPPDKFPRAVFGLPIVFHFVKEQSLSDVSLQGKSERHDRLSSPLILRPLSYDENRALGIAAILKGWSFPTEGLKLVPKKKSPSDVALSQLRLTPGEVETLKLDYISGNEKDALHAFMNYLRQEGNR